MNQKRKGPGRPPGTGKADAQRTQMKLPPTIRELARIVGGGDMTAGTESLFSQLPVFYRIKVFLEILAEDENVPQAHREQAEALLLDLEDLEIDRVYEESVTEGITVQGKDGEPTAWIV